MSAMTNYLENKLTDWLLRGQTFTPPATLYIALLTAVTDADAGTVTEVSGGSYARASFTPSLANWSGTQGAGTTVASSGTGGASSNNIAITTFPTPTANWGVVTHIAIYDATTAGNPLFVGALTTSKTINNGDPAPTIAAGALGITLA